LFLGMTPAGNSRWQTRVCPTGHRECTPNMATPLDPTSMMKFLDVLAGLIVFPGWLAANPKSGRQCEPQRGLCSRKRRLRTTTSDNESVEFELFCTPAQEELIFWLALGTCINRMVSERQVMVLRQSIPAKMALNSKAAMMSRMSVSKV